MLEAERYCPPTSSSACCPAAITSRQNGLPDVEEDTSPLFERAQGERQRARAHGGGLASERDAEEAAAAVVVVVGGLPGASAARRTPSAEGERFATAARRGDGEDDGENVGRQELSTAAAAAMSSREEQRNDRSSSSSRSGSSSSRSGSSAISSRNASRSSSSSNTIRLVGAEEDAGLWSRRCRLSRTALGIHTSLLLPSGARDFGSPPAAADFDEYFDDFSPTSPSAGSEPAGVALPELSSPVIGKSGDSSEAAHAGDACVGVEDSSPSPCEDIVLSETEVRDFDEFDRLLSFSLEDEAQLLETEPHLIDSSGPLPANNGGASEEPWLGDDDKDDDFEEEMKTCQCHAGVSRRCLSESELMPSCTSSRGCDGRTRGRASRASSPSGVRTDRFDLLGSERECGCDFHAEEVQKKGHPSSKGVVTRGVQVRCAIGDGRRGSTATSRGISANAESSDVFGVAGPVAEHGEREGFSERAVRGKTCL